MKKYSINLLIETATNKNNFTTLQNYIDFSLGFLDYIENNKQAIIVSQNESIYNFFQFPEDVSFKITRPFNSSILLKFIDFDRNTKIFQDTLKQIKKAQNNANVNNRDLINRVIYTLQQCIGFTLDAYSATRESNTARKLNGDLFERLIFLVLQEIGLQCKSGTIKVPIKDEKQELFHMNYQQDLIIEKDNIVKIIGSVKTTSKDRIDKVFIDKYLYSKLTDTTIPHIAVFLHDVQRKNTKKENEFSINSTFLCNRFKGYTIKLNPLDGVYYFDPRPIMRSDKMLSSQIRTFDHLICDDVWQHLY